MGTILAVALAEFELAEGEEKDIAPVLGRR